MPFEFTGVVSGGNFNNIAGNMTQVLNWHPNEHQSSTPLRTHDLMMHDRSLGGSVRQRARPSSVWHPYYLHRDSGHISRNTGTKPNQVIGHDISLHGDRRPPIEHFEPLNHTYNSVGGNMTQVISYGESGINLLHRHVVTEALHDSVERFQEPACHPGTRTEVLNELRSWSTETNPNTTLLWMHGSAGMGKSAIAQMFAGDCESYGRLGASFFFRRNHPRRGKWNSFIATIAYQLANTLPEFLLPLQQAVEHNKLVIGRSMTIQFQRLLLGPFTQVTSLPFVPVVIIDGLDECEDHKTQQQILRLFIDAVRNGQLPIRLLITSRPEPHLREVLETAETFAICRPLVLRADKSAYEDISTYFRAEFSRIHSDHAPRGIYLGAPWPSTETLDHLIAMSCGIFVYATTVIGFISDEYSHPEDRLASVLRLDPHSTTTLDDLYSEILSILSPEPQNLRILHSIYHLALDPEEIDTLLRLRPGTCRLAVRGLHSLLEVPQIRPWSGYLEHVKLLHASFADYLSNPHRSGAWCFSIPWLHFDCLESIIRLLSSPLPTYSAWWFHR
ncbi:hypothetical protein B0H19DRAFT_1025321 [Mycena capillaripes]|nr:hypothetical protein B0H19DRAFT_1025321 [Mycena capillaripes]